LFGAASLYQDGDSTPRGDIIRYVEIEGGQFSTWLTESKFRSPAAPASGRPPHRAPAAFWTAARLKQKGEIIPTILVNFSELKKSARHKK